MGFLFLGLALAAGATKGYCGKKTSGYLRTPHEAVSLSLIRMIICSVFGLLMALISEGGNIGLDGRALVIALLSGISTAAFILSWIFAVRTSAYMMVDVALTAGVVIPIVFSAAIFGEEVGARHIIGCALLFIAVIVMSSYNKGVKASFDAKGVALLIICGVSHGCSDLLQKVYNYSYSGEEHSAASFNFYTYLFAAAIFVITFCITHTLEKAKRRSQAISKNEVRATDTAPENANYTATSSEKNDAQRGIDPLIQNASLGRKMLRLLPYIAVMAICIFLNSYFKTLAAASLPSVVIFPTLQVGSMILSSLMATLLFGEKMNLKGVVGITTALAAMLIINL